MTSNTNSDSSARQSDKRYVLYLTPAEEDVWTNVMVMAQEHGDELIVDIPVDPKDLMRYWRSEKLESSTAEYCRAVTKLEKSGILSDKGFVSNGTKRRYSFRISPDTFLVVNISCRIPSWWDARDIEVTREVQRYFLERENDLPTKNAIIDAIDNACRIDGDENEKGRVRRRYLAIMLLGKWMKDQIFLEGMFHQAEGHEDGFLVAYPGYEPFRLYDERWYPKQGARIVVLPSEGVGGESGSTFFLSDFDIGFGEDVERVLSYYPDGEIRTDVERVMLGRLSLEELELRKKFYQSLTDQVAVWSAELDAIIESRKSEEEDRKRKEQELERLTRELYEADKTAKEALYRKCELEATLQQNQDSSARWSIQRVGRYVRCTQCGQPAMHGDTVCYNCK
jgi:hypothetical protein